MKVEDLKLDSLAGDQSVTLFTPETANGSGLMLVHGYQSSRKGYAEYAEAVAESLGTTCLTLDLAGHGESSGELSSISPRQHNEDLKTAYDFLASRQNIRPDKISIVGASYGGYLAVMLSREKEIEGMVLRAPAIYDDGLFDAPRENMDEASTNEFRSKIDPSTEVEALDAVRHFEGKIIVVESEMDESIPSNVMRAYAEAAKNGTLKVIKGAKHSLEGAERDEFKNILLHWQERLQF